MADEKKEATLIVRMKPSIKAKAVRLAAAEGRSLANYIERLIDQAPDEESKAKRQRNTQGGPSRHG